MTQQEFFYEVIARLNSLNEHLSQQLVELKEIKQNMIYQNDQDAIKAYEQSRNKGEKK